MRFLEQVRDVLIVSLVASFIWFAVYVAVLECCARGSGNTITLGCHRKLTLIKGELNQPKRLITVMRGGVRGLLSAQVRSNDSRRAYARPAADRDQEDLGPR